MQNPKFKESMDFHLSLQHELWVVSPILTKKKKLTKPRNQWLFLAPSENWIHRINHHLENCRDRWYREYRSTYLKHKHAGNTSINGNFNELLEAPLLCELVGELTPGCPHIFTVSWVALLDFLSGSDSEDQRNSPCVWPGIERKKLFWNKPREFSITQGKNSGDHYVMNLATKFNKN